MSDDFSALMSWMKTTGLENIVWITDVDETLLEKSKNPNNVTYAPDLESSCETLDQITGGGFYVVTGRDFEWLDQAFPNKSIRASCEYHCLFRADAGEKPAALNPKPMWELIDKALDNLTDKYEGLMMRKKEFMRTLHYSGVADDKREQIKHDLEITLEALLDHHNQLTGQNVGMVDGGDVFDMGPSQTDKGTAINDILDQAQKIAGKKLIPIYFGDSPGDIPGALAAQAAGGKFISVGDDKRLEAFADFKLKNPKRTRALIRDVIKMAEPSLETGPGLIEPKSP